MPVYSRIKCPNCKTWNDVRIKKHRKQAFCKCGQFVNVASKDCVFWIEYYYQGRRIREKVGQSKALAENALRKKELDIAENKYLDVKKDNSIKFSDFADEYLENHSKVNNKTWRVYDQHNIRKLRRFFGDRTLGEIDVHLITKYKAERARCVAVATVNRELALIKSMFNKAIAWGKFAGNNPAKLVKFFKENNQRTRYLEKTEVESLLSNCNDYLKPIVITVLNTGMRRGEVLKLKWSDINFATNTIYLKDTKNGEPREIPMNENVRAVLNQRARHPESDYVFCKKDGSYIGDIKKSFFTALNKSGIKDFRFHDLRHSFASHLAMKGIDLNTIRELLGHKSMAMTIRYSHLSQQHKKRAVDVLNTKIDTQLTHSVIEEKQSDFDPNVSSLMVTT